MAVEEVAILRRHQHEHGVQAGHSEGDLAVEAHAEGPAQAALVPHRHPSLAEPLVEPRTPWEVRQFSVLGVKLGKHSVGE